MFHWPQITLLIYCAVNLVAAGVNKWKLFKAGKPSNRIVWTVVINTAVVLGLVTAGGFFHGG